MKALIKSAISAGLICTLSIGLGGLTVQGLSTSDYTSHTGSSEVYTVSDDKSKLESLSLELGGICEIDGVYYLSDRFTRSIYTLEGGKLSLLCGQPAVTDLYGRPITGYTDGSFTRAAFGEPCAVVPYNDGLLICDRENDVLRYVDLRKNRVYTLAGSGEPGFADGIGSDSELSSPTALVVGEDGTIYFSDSGNHAIRCVDTDGRVTTLIGGIEGSALGSAKETRLSYPTGLCILGDSLYIADSGNHRIVVCRDGECSLVAGAMLEGDKAIEGDYLNGKLELARFSNPMALTVRDGVIYVADTGNSAIRVIRDGYVTTLQKTPEQLMSPDSFFTVGDTVYFSDSFHRKSHVLPELTDAESYYDDCSDCEYGDAIRFVSVNRLMNGTGEYTFSPDAPITRGMLLTILARHDGMDTTQGELWYDIGVQWGLDKGVSDGTLPETNITLEQLLTMLYRYAGEPEIESASGLTEVSDYAKDAVIWAIESGIASIEATIAPRSLPTRAQTADILMKFLLIA